MQKLPQHDRLRAGLTCSTWRTAANAATAKIKCRRLDDQRFGQLMQWLQRWSQQLGSLRMVLHQTQQLQQLPCNTLSKLMVRGGELQPPLLFPPLVSTLTKLVLENTSLLISAQQQSLVLRQELSRLTNLRHLALRIRGWQQAAADEGTWQFLMPLQDLTELRLGADCGAGMMPGLAMNISRFISLQVLEIEDTVYRSAPQVDPLCSLQHLQSLRKLRLSGNGCRITQNSSTSLGSLTGLSCLQLQLCYFSVAAVSAITGLQSLSVQHPYYPVTAAKLYAWLPGLQQLTSLCLGGQRVSPADLPAGPDRNAACRAPTGSRYLQKLDLQNVYMPEDTWQHVFPADKEMVQLTYLKLPRGLESIPGGTLGTATVQGIVRCCPCLQALEGGRHMPLLRDISALCNLTSLVAWRAGDAAAADTLSMLTALQHLELHGSSDCQQHNFVPILRLGLLTNLSLPESGWQRQQNEPPTPAQDFVCDTLSQLTSLVKLNTTAFALTDGQLQQLTALTGLSSLVIKLDGFSEQLKARLQDLGNYQTFQCFLTSKAPRGTPHDIYLQLRRCFEAAAEVELHDDEQHRQLPEPPSHPPDDSAEQPAPALRPAGH